jgi:predicted aspartyl protease
MAAADRISFLAGRTLVTVPALLNRNLACELVVDSGAERMMISPRIAFILALDLRNPLRFEPLAGVGRTPPVPVVRLDEVRVGASRVQNLLASVLDLPTFFRADGLIGLNFLRRFRVTFEFDRRMLVLREPPTPARRSGTP